MGSIVVSFKRPLVMGVVVTKHQQMFGWMSLYCSKDIQLGRYSIAALVSVRVSGDVGTREDV